eukprot:581976-Prymnesium_polylepis.1
MAALRHLSARVEPHVVLAVRRDGEEHQPAHEGEVLKKVVADCRERSDAIALCASCGSHAVCASALRVVARARANALTMGGRRLWGD